MDNYFNTNKTSQVFGWLNYSTLLVGLYLSLMFKNQSSRNILFMTRFLYRHSLNTSGYLLSLWKRKLQLYYQKSFHLSSMCGPVMEHTILQGFTSFPSTIERGYEMRLLALSHMGDELSLNTQQHYDFLRYILDIYGMP